MVRTPRRIGVDEPAEITLQQALDWELTGGWPSRAEFHRFWNGARVPVHFREVSQPDPRAVLGDESHQLAYHAELDAWQSTRLAWLREQASG